MPADTSVKFIHSGMSGVPILGAAGGLIAVLDACLVNGFAVSAVASLVVTDAVATATVSGGHSAEVGSVVLVSGATLGDLNGEKKVLSVGGGNTTLTFDATGVTNQTATGSISLKIAGAGWSKAYQDTNQAAYKSNSLLSTGCFLWVNDAGSRVARCIGYESMSHISSGVAPFPTSAQKSGGVYWTRSASSPTNSWVVIADDRCFYFLSRYAAGAPASGELSFFGDLVPFKSGGDAWACALSGMASDRSLTTPGMIDDYATMSQSVQQLYLPRPHAGAGGSIYGRGGFSIPLHFATASFASGAGPVKYPNGPDNGLYLSEHFVSDSDDKSLRGISPGLYCSPQAIPAGWVEPHYRLTGVAMLPGRELRVEPYGADSGALGGYAFFDTTGPWR